MEFDFNKQPGLQRNKEFWRESINPQLTIITPFYNAKAYFEQTFNCVINQTFCWFEWLIIDDGSTDIESVELLQKLSVLDNRIRVFRKENGGPASARNYAVSKANTDIIVSLDADDLIEATYLEMTFFALYFNPEATWAYTDSLGFQDQEYIWKVPFNSERLKKENFLIEIGTFRKKDFLAAGGYDDRQKFSHEDWNMWLRFMVNGGYPVHICSLGAWYRRIDCGAYSVTLNNSEIERNAYARIKETSDKITSRVEAIQYPRRSAKDMYIQPVRTKLNLKKRKDKKEILFIIPWIQMGGADLFNLEVLKLINKDVFNVSVMTTVPDENPLIQRFREYTDQIYELPNFLDDINYAEFISYYIESRGVDLLFISNSYYAYYALPWIRNEYPHLPVVDCFHIEEWYWKNGGYARCSKVFADYLDKTFVSTKHLKNVMRDKFERSEENVDVVYTGVDEDKFDSTLIHKGTIRKQLNILPDTKVVLFVCRIHPQKRPFLMLEIAKKIIDKNDDYVFLIVGDGPQLNEVKSKAAGLGILNNLRFVGMQEDLRPYYVDSDVMLLCSIKEGISITTLESCSMKLPVVSSDVGGQSEIVDESVGAILPMLQDEATDFDSRSFSEEEVNQYVSAIEDILSDKQKYQIKCETCRKKIEKEFSTKIMINKVESEFLRLIREYSEKDTAVGAEDHRNISLSKEILAIYSEMLNYEKTAAEIWQAKEWFEAKYNQEVRRNEEILQSKTWKVFEKCGILLRKMHLVK